MEIDALLAAILAARNEPKTIGSGVKRPVELDSPDTDPTLRAAILEHYTAKVSDLPSSTRSKAEAQSVRDQVAAVLKKGW